MTDEAKALVEECRLDANAFRENTVYDSDGDPIRLIANADRLDQYADLIETQAREIERLRLDVEAQEALQVSAYHAGLRAGWNFGVSDDNAGMQAAMANTDHIKELRRIREARATLAGDSHDQ